MLASSTWGGPMRFRFSLDVSRHGHGVSGLLCLVVLIVGTVCANAQAEGSDPADDSAATQPQDSSRHEPLKKNAKYDVERIGHRGIGRGFNIYSVKREQDLGANFAAALDRNSKPITDPLINEYVMQLAQRIVRNSDAEIPFTVRLISGDEVPRAYGLPGGFLYVDSALLFAAESEAELVGLMAHEIAHVAARHATRALTRKYMCSVTGSLFLLAGPAGLLAEDATGVAGPLSARKFSRDAEYEADLLGLEYAYAAGYDPQALLSALEKLHAIEASRRSAFTQVPGYHLVSKMPFHDKIAKGLSSYPLIDERIHRLQSEIPTYLPDRKNYILDTDEFQEMKSRLLALEGPLQLRRHNEDEDPKGPVLRRIQEQEPEAKTSSGNLRNAFTLLP